MNLRDFKTAKERRAALEAETGINLSAVGASVDLSSAEGRNIENLIGGVLVPLGIAGPLMLQRAKGKGQIVYLPLATTEGALVASVSRGCKATSLSGGIITHSFKVGTTRGPVFYTGSLKKTNQLFRFIKDHEKEIAETAEKTSHHLRFKKVQVRSLANYVFARFYFDTKDAMGMNMVTIATQAICDLIEKKTGIGCLSVAGNFDIDKKPAWLNSINARGTKVWAEAVISKKILQDVLKTTAEKIFDVWLAKCMIGSAMSGSLGFNAHYANIIAALFLATGQDAAHVVEGSLGITTTKIVNNGDLYFSIYLPSLMIGTVGGGTHLPTQREALMLLGVLGPEKVDEFAHIIGGAVLAGELSLLASLSAGTLAKAHETLGRAKR